MSKFKKGQSVLVKRGKRTRKGLIVDFTPCQRFIKVRYDKTQGKWFSHTDIFFNDSKPKETKQ